MIMSVQCGEFYNLADKLHKKNLNAQEICYRSSINRAYYGAFHAAKIYLNLRGKVPHSEVILKLTRNHRTLGDMLSTLFETRKDADYEIDMAIGESDVRKALKKADVIIYSLAPTKP